jgi:hypothetical protein
VKAKVVNFEAPEIQPHIYFWLYGGFPVVFLYQMPASMFLFGFFSGGMLLFLVKGFKL